jgi:DNA/RNA-binding domain of Phe-tRNA-synthetase-like protein
MNISIDTSIQALVPNCRLGYIQIHDVSVREKCTLLEQEFLALQETVAHEYRLESLSAVSRIAVVRSMYKKLKFDPSRYRPASEALVRRILQNKGLFHVNSAVDVNNYCSIRYLWPFGLYDAEHVAGDVIYKLAEEGTYENIAGNQVSTEGKPFLSDEQGVFGNPTSDSRRTSVTTATRQLLSVIFADEEVSDAELLEAVDFTAAIMIRYNSGTVIKQGIIKG